MQIRTAEHADLPAIQAIYADAVRMRCTAHTLAPSPEEWDAWLRMHAADEWPVYVATIDQTVAAWLSFSAYRPGRQAFANVAELSFYVDPLYRKAGIGKQLLAFAIETAPSLGLKHLVCLILAWNTPSINLVKKFGFELWGTMPMIAEFESQQCSHLYYGCTLAAPSNSSQQEFI